ncbi:MAG: MoxR family ATPase [Myxococcota bacterium]
MAQTSVAHISENATQHSQRLVQNVAQVVRGKEDVIKLAVVSLLARGHLLLEDVPGVGKTTMARALAASIGVSFRRLQCTSDLMPTDVLGGNVFNQSKGTFEFRAGPIFTQVLLADEVNRTTPKTQSALLEAMDERQVSIDGETHQLEEPFFVVATQNPQEFYGTYPLPESQLDRFLVRLSIGYPPPGVEREVLNRRGADPVQQLEPVMTAAELRHVQQAVDAVRVDDAIVDYLHRIIIATRSTPLLSVGVSTRGALGFERAARARALVEGRSYVLPDDVKALAEPVLAHRVKVSGAVAGTQVRDDAQRVIRELLTVVAVPL